MTESFLICRFIGERNRSLCERLFWVLFVTIGAFLAAYFTLGIIEKWKNSPVYMSVESTSYHVKDIPFPAITICSVNKVVRNRLSKSIKGIVAVQNANNVNSIFNSTMDLEAVSFMIESLVRYDKVNYIVSFIMLQ